VSWFSRIFGKLFGGKKVQPAPVPSGLKSRKTAAGVVSSKAVASDTAPSNITHAEHTLGWLLGSSQAAMTQTIKYDLENPPCIDPDVLSRLRMHIRRIPPMPEVWHQVQDILQRPGVSAGDLGQCVAQDPVLTARILTVCNSSAYASSHSAEITNIRLAIARLGLNEACNIIFHSLAPDLGGSAYKKTEIRHVWFHSQAIATLSRFLSESSSKLDRHTASLAGMLHDIGKLVMLHIESEAQLSRLMNRIEPGVGALAAEYEEFGYTHIDAGMMLALHWRLPKSVQDMISLHQHANAADIRHLPENVRPLMAILQTAHLVLQHNMDDTRDRVLLSVWHSHRRTCRDDIAPFVQNELCVPLDSQPVYTQLQAEIDRLKLSFSDLFQLEEGFKG